MGRTGGNRIDRTQTRALALWAVIAWLVIWQVAAWALGNGLLLPGPIDVALRLVEDAATTMFWQRVAFTILRIGGGVVAGWITGALAAVAATRSARARELIEVPMMLARSVPVASFTVLALIWLSARNLSVFVVALVVTPIVYENIASALDARNTELAEMARVFRIRPWRRFRLVDLPQLRPSLRATCRLTLGMAWKAGVAAEVIGIPMGSLGEAIYQTKVHFDTAGLFSWTIAVVVCSIACELFATFILEKTCSLLAQDASRARTPHGSRNDDRYLESSPHSPATSSSSPICASHDDSTREGKALLTLTGVTRRLPQGPEIGPASLAVSSGEPLCIMAPSGSGKSTLLRIAAGLDMMSGGSIDFEVDGEARHTWHASMVFQDDRLCEQADAVANTAIALTGPHAPQRSRAVLESLGLGGCTGRSVQTLSGGQRRRVALARALVTDADILLLDEPFNGLDEEARAKAAALVRDRARRAPTIIATHVLDDAQLLDARIVRLENP